jgi:hypothetical protein
LLGKTPSPSRQNADFPAYGLVSNTLVPPDQLPSALIVSAPAKTPRSRLSQPSDRPKVEGRFATVVWKN